MKRVKEKKGTHLVLAPGPREFSIGSRIPIDVVTVYTRLPNAIGMYLVRRRRVMSRTHVMNVGHEGERKHLFQ